MTFEEFFTKKKIDLKALKAADEPLFEEFKAHYSAMGEKSFDHSKKFWFNKLRKSFHLAEEEAVLIKKPVQTDHVETAPAAKDTIAAKPAGFKPRFKAATPAEPADQKEEPKTDPSTTRSEATDSTVAETPKPAGFKPRFKPGITKNTANTTETPTPTDSSGESVPETPKPTGFKPRFKPGVTKAAASEQSAPLGENPVTASETKAPEAAETAKPTGFKPRFKAGVTKTESADAAAVTSAEGTDTQPTAESGQPIPSDAAASNTVTTAIEGQTDNTDDHITTAANKPAGFKPRFKPGVTKTESADSTQKKTTPVANTVDKQQQEISEQEPTIAKPKGFTPRFKAGITKTGSTDNIQAAESVQSATPSVEDATTTPVSANSAATADTSSTTEAPNSLASEISKPTGFKPRFKAGITKTANTDSTPEVVPPTEDLNLQQTAAPTLQATPTPTESSMDKPTDELQQNNDTTQEQAAANKPTGFKPRFKAGLTKIDKKEE
ncbi:MULTISPECIES: hypothetical protein [Sphingobacterium]|uniref:hypothetical protein n=1 Tax=Sphingobacterium TaxID=28453 RepID=UPI00257EC966|nr:MULTISPECIES: hypothetical protein [Sphingobacterium]